VSTSVGEESPALEEERRPDWSPVPEQEAGRTGPGAVIRRAALALAVVVVLWWLDHRVMAVVLLCLALSVSAASQLSPAVGRAIGRGEHVIERVVGRVLSAVLLTIVELLVFTPISAVLRVVGHDPLAPGSTKGEASLWREHPESPRGPLHDRPYAYERLPRPAGARRTRLGWLGLAIGVVATVFVLDVAAGAGLDALRGQQRAPTTSLLTLPDVPAGEHEPWRRQVGDGIDQAVDRERYDPYLGWRIHDVHARYVNVSGGVRRSYEPAGARDPDAIEVLFLGGSAMFGAFQRDEHTIPSEFARLAEADGIHVRVVNQGQLAYMNWQETLLYQSLVSGGARPDLTVFYDGANELLSQFADGPHRTPTHLEASQVAERLAQTDPQRQPSDTRSLYDAWRDVSVAYGLGRSLGLLPRTEAQARLQSPWAGDQADHPGVRGADAAAVYSRGVGLARRLGDSYGLRTAFVWQPFLYSKRAVPGERPVVGWLGTDPDAWRTAGRVARSHLGPGVIDLGAALDGVNAPLMYDLAHTNELGARVVARALYARLRPQLLELQSGRSR
jgi:hypothetical protein